LKYDILESKTVKLEFEGGIIVEGEIVTGSRNTGEIILIRFKTVLLHGETVLFQPGGVYDMAVGKKVVSAFSGLLMPIVLI
jgi:phenylalanine-4-hydroxylase